MTEETPIHIKECHHAFIKDGRVVQVAVFDGHPSDLIRLIVDNLQADFAKCCTDHGAANLHDEWDVKKEMFIPATLEYLEKMYPKPVEAQPKAIAE